VGFLTNPKTGKGMTADELIEREKKEWGDAFKIFAKELLSSGDKSGMRFLATLDKDLVDMIRDHKARKKKR
jgi:hypothetical protein